MKLRRLSPRVNGKLISFDCFCKVSLLQVRDYLNLFHWVFPKFDDRVDWAKKQREAEASDTI